MKILRTASLGSNFSGSYKKKSAVKKYIVQKRKSQNIKNT